MLGRAAIRSRLSLDDGAEFSRFFCGSGESGLWMNEEGKESVERASEGGGGEREQGEQEGRGVEGRKKTRSGWETGKGKCTDFIAPRRGRIGCGPCARSASDRG